MNVTPGVLESNQQEMSQKALLFSNKSTAELVQIDVCDGVFVQSSTWPYSTGEGLHEWQKVVGSFRDAGVLVEFDLMIDQPEQTLVSYLMANPRRVIIHFASTQHIDRCFAVLHGYNQDYPKFEYGIAITVNDNFDDYYKYLKRVHFVQVMGIEHIGVQGQMFTDEVYSVVHKIRTSDPELPIQVDGGVSTDTIVPLKNAGVSVVVVGSALFNTTDPVLARAELLGVVR